MTKAKPPKTKKLKVPKLKETYEKNAPQYARRQRAEILRKMTEEAQATGRDKKLDVTLDQVRIVELEAENADLEAEGRVWVRRSNFGRASSKQRSSR